MIIEFKLCGSKTEHRGCFEATGFYAKWVEEKDDVNDEILYYTIFSHFSFSFEHLDEAKANEVWGALVKCLTSQSDVVYEVEGVGFIRAYP